MLMIIELNGRGRWIRTIESSANGFTVRPLWPLGNPSMYACLFLRLLCHLRSHRYSSTIVHSVPRSLDFAHSDKNPAHKIHFFSDCFVIFDRVGEQKFLINGAGGGNRTPNLLITNQLLLSLIHISEPTRQAEISYAVFCLKKKKKQKKKIKKNKNRIQIITEQ